MGIYQHVHIYHGRMLSATTVQRLGSIVPREFITQVADDRWALHAPGQFEAPKLMHPDVFEQAKDQGWFAYEPSWPVASAADAEKLAELVRAAANDPTAMPGTYMCEASSSTLDVDSPWKLICNIHVSK